nr:putative ribonuclease H-like domain-containing protein [Tanacetum cinerariifolium]
MSNPHPKRNFVPRTVLMRSGFKTLNTTRQNSSKAVVSVNTARQIHTTYPRPTVNSARPVSNVFNRAHSHDIRPFNKFTANKDNNFSEKVNTVMGNITIVGPRAMISDNKGNKVNVVKASSCWVWSLKHKVLDHVFRNNGASITLKKFDYIDVQGRSKHMTRNMFYLFDYKKLMVDMLPLEETSKELLDESQVLLRVPRKNNMYSVDLKNVAPSGGLTYLFGKATLYESNIWLWRLGHINSKTMNKLVKRNLVGCLPSKNFKNDHKCVAYQKGKQHRASCKTKTVSSISQPLQMLHMDLFGPTFVKSLMKKIYCLVVTNDFSGFSWVFFLATKDEISDILKSFITDIKNLKDLRMKVIRYDNRTEFKNKVMNQLCEMKVIKRKFSVARTP